MKKPQSRHLPFALAGSDTGFTLVELAVGTAVGALVIIITTAVFAPLLRLHKQLDSQIRLQERWSRVQFLLNSEIQEAESVNYISNGLRIVNSSGSIDYIWDPGEQILNRSGPGIDCHGELRLGGKGADCSGIPISDDSDTSLVSTGVIVFTPVLDNNQSVTYSMTFRDPLNPNGSTYKKESSAGVGTSNFDPKPGF